VLAVLFGALAGATFGLLLVSVRFGLTRGVDQYAGAVAMLGVALAVCAILAVPSIVGNDVHAADLWPFALAGLVAPGAAQIILIMAIRDAGPSRAAILIGTTPLLSVAIALTLLDEPFRPWLLVGTVLVVGGGALLAFERSRPEHFRALGAALALMCALLFAIRDNVTRWAARAAHPPPALVAAAVAIAAAFALVTTYVLVTRPRALQGRVWPAVVAYAPAGVALAAGYVFLLVAFDHGRVSIVAPLNATQSLWAVVFAAVLIGRHLEGIGRRLVVAGALVVAGSAVIGVVR
jgi:drug/metabolite transporter (DMT)-like permease